MRRRMLALTSCVLVVVAGCTTSEETVTGEAPSPSLDRLGVFDMANGCEGLRRVRTGELSFVFDEELFVARPNGEVARCVLEVADPIDLEWGPEGDRLHFGDLRRYDGEEIVSIDDAVESISWSRPTGTSVVYISDEGLMKVDAFGEKPFEISFLADHDEVVYHPAGTHVAVTGTDKDGTYGLWLATNLGEESQLLAIGEDARRIFSLSFSHDGTTLYYAAEHDDRYDLHSLRLALQDEEGETRDAELATLDSAPSEMGDVVASEFLDGTIAYTVGSCAAGKTTHVWNGSVTEIGGELAGLSAEPVGWLPTGELLILARASGCEGTGTLYLWEPKETTRLVSDVSAAGVRAVLPPPPGPPGSQQQVVA